MKKYPEWNPTLQLVKGEIKQGNKVTYKFTEEDKSQDSKKSYDVSAKVFKIKPYEFLNQGGGILIILTYYHQYKIEPVGK